MNYNKRVRQCISSTSVYFCLSKVVSETPFRHRTQNLVSASWGATNPRGPNILSPPEIIFCLRPWRPPRHCLYRMNAMTNRRHAACLPASPPHSDIIQQSSWIVNIHRRPTLSAQSPRRHIIHSTVSCRTPSIRNSYHGNRYHNSRFLDVCYIAPPISPPKIFSLALGDLKYHLICRFLGLSDSP